MFGRIWNQLRGSGEEFAPQFLFEPLYSLEQIRAIGQWPIVTVLPFATNDEASNRLTPGVGVGKLLANLLRRNLLLSRQISVVGREDTLGQSPDDDDEGLDFESLTHGECDVLVCGRVYSHSQHEGVLKLYVLRAGQPPVEALRVKFPIDQIAKLMAYAARQLAESLRFKVTPEITELWQVGQPRDWRSLCRAADCIERNDNARLANLVESDVVHADALLFVQDDDDNTSYERDLMPLALQRDPYNTQLLFHQFCVLWQSTNTFEPGPANALRQGLTYGPGHGKSHMCLPHVTARIKPNVPYILAHSECGYHLLRTNAFSLNNFSNYLQAHAPNDDRIPALFERAVELDPLDPISYAIAADYLLEHGQPAAALPFAQGLVNLCTPPIHDRTMYCFRQNPANAKVLDQGDVDLLQHVRCYLDRCHEALGRR